MLFGVNLSTSARSGNDPVASAWRAEVLGFDFVSASDHLHGTHPTFETWTLLSWVASRTTRISVLPNVLGLPYRPPPVVAKMAEGIQRLSGGRLLLGLGAGGSDDEFTAFGLGTRTPGEKLRAFEEAVQIMKGMWTQSPFSFAGDHYSVNEAMLEPKPDPPIPIWVGGYGPRMLDAIGRLADGWLPSLPLVGPDTVPERMARVRAAAEGAGRDPDTLTYAYNVGVHVGEDRADARVVSGTADQVADRLRSFIALGFNALNFWPVGNEAEQQELLATDVVRQLR